MASARKKWSNPVLLVLSFSLLVFQEMIHFVHHPVVLFCFIFSSSSPISLLHPTISAFGAYMRVRIQARMRVRGQADPGGSQGAFWRNRQDKYHTTQPETMFQLRTRLNTAVAARGPWLKSFDRGIDRALTIASPRTCPTNDSPTEKILWEGIEVVCCCRGI